MRYNRGYTLLEILLSLIIVVTLSLVFVGVTKKIQQRNQIRSTALQMTAMTNAAVNYYKMYDRWPTAITTLGTLLNTDLTCSAWRNASDCVPYQIMPIVNSRYFAVAVDTPSAAIATRLAAQLPTAYQNGVTVTAYATTFPGFPPDPIPAGVSLSANSLQIGGGCNTSPYPNPFSNCFSTTSTPAPQPYGLIDLNAQTRDAIVSQNVFAIMRSVSVAGGGSVYSTNFTDTISPTCPQGLQKTMFFLPAGTRTAIPLTGSAAATAPMFTIMFDNYLKNGSNWQLNLNSIIGGTGGTSAAQNVMAGAGDIFCVPSASFDSGWPAG